MVQPTNQPASLPHDTLYVGVEVCMCVWVYVDMQVCTGFSVCVCVSVDVLGACEHVCVGVPRQVTPHRAGLLTLAKKSVPLDWEHQMTRMREERQATSPNTNDTMVTCPWREGGVVAGGSQGGWKKVRDYNIANWGGGGVGVAQLTP